MEDFAQVLQHVFKNRDKNGDFNSSDLINILQDYSKNISDSKNSSKFKRHDNNGHGSSNQAN